MTRLSLFNSPFLLGFDELERALDRVSKSSSEGYPPYNIERTGENDIRITLAVAGFAREDLSIKVEAAQLVIRGKQNDDLGREFLHRGIAAREFQRSFLLASGISVIGAELDNGLLHISLERPVVETLSRTIEINTRGQERQTKLKAVEV
ncbi:MAG: heat-shock protein Hsp20 [Pelagibacteraceae bacterium]|nr:heat-shock protein Hsp20 [Pelagibacteraceae bacterium]PPR10844.1 MAG: Small heat shock protein IbpA [Alphaproteobacteria bacterium MarineAlpha11_Bin1]|tara:strand:+ start:3282 stop:3731 length:450 start_codon:yes stop_codon:yes gene_type:complete